MNASLRKLYVIHKGFNRARSKQLWRIKARKNIKSINSYYQQNLTLDFIHDLCPLISFQCCFNKNGDLGVKNRRLK